jgi:tetratricopeptide (TPR) repeat protein
MPDHSGHLLASGSSRSERAVFIAGLDLGTPMLRAVDAHRRLRGPYTAAGAIVRQLVDGPLRGSAGLVEAHQVEILAVAPELRGQIPATQDTLTSIAVPKERTRFYSRNRTGRLAHGLAELIRDTAAQDARGRRYLVIENIDHADPTDREFAAILLRRLDPGLITLVIGRDLVTPAATEGPGLLEAALARYARQVEAPAPEGLAEPGDPGRCAQRAAEYVASHCTSDEPELRASYRGLADVERMRLHDDQAVALEALDEHSLRLGAIPFHREHGSDPSGAGAAALEHALDYCLDMGFYDATVAFGERGRAVIDWERQAGLYWTFTTKMTTSLAALGRPAEAHALYDEARALSANPLLHMQAAYATAMLYTRHYEDERRDHETALGWINEAIGIATMMADPSERTFNTVFNENGKALIQAHLGRSDEALRLVAEGLARLDRELEPGEHLLHRSVLMHNRAQVLTGLGRLDEALADYNGIIERDPHYDEYYFNRAALLRRLGRPAEALADYDTAIRLSPPFAEFRYNRADLRAEVGDLTGALADFGCVLELSPENVDARVNRAALRLECGELDAAQSDLESGLELSPGHPHLLGLLGRLKLAREQPEEAIRAFDAAIEADATLPQAWAARAEALFQTGALDAALADLDRSLEIAEDPAALFNRGVVREARGEWKHAEADFGRALDLAPGDADARDRLAACQARLAS